jgi:hypothetical protein
MTSVAQIAERLAKLVRILSSEDEAAATARAIMKTLKSAGCDIHDLASAIETNGGKAFTEAQMQEIYKEVFADGQRAAAPKQYKPQGWLEMVETCFESIDLLGARDQEFIRSVRARIRLGNEPSEKQQKWLKDCYQKVAANGFKPV